MKKLKILNLQTIFNINQGFAFLILMGTFAYGSIFIKIKNKDANYLPQPAPVVIVDNSSVLEKGCLYRSIKKNELSSNSFFKNKNFVIESNNNNQIYANNCNSNSLMELLCYFSKQHQMSSFINAIEKSGFGSVTTLDESSVLGLHSQRLNDDNSTNKINNKRENYNALVSLGTGMELKNSVITVNSTCNLKEKIMEMLTAEINTLKATQLLQELHPFWLDMQCKLADLLQASIERHRIGAITLTNLRSIPNRTSRSGISILTDTGHNLPITTQQLESFFIECNISHQYGPYQGIINSLQHLFGYLIEVSEHGLNPSQAGYRLRLRQSLRFLEGVDIIECSIIESITKQNLTKQICPLNLQIYTKPFFGINGSFCFNLENKDASIGLGKALFFPYKNSNFGITTGLDLSVSLNSQNNNLFDYKRLKGKTFIGLGYII